MRHLSHYLKVTLLFLRDFALTAAIVAVLWMALMVPLGVFSLFCFWIGVNPELLAFLVMVTWMFIAYVRQHPYPKQHDT